MRSTRARVSSVLATALLLALGSTAQAEPVYFDFSAPCIGFQGSGCAAYGLNEGDLVSGTLTLDMALVTPGGTASSVHNDPGTAFSFVFGNQAFDLDDLVDPFIDVSFNADATLLTCFSGFNGCPNDPSDYAGFNNGGAVPAILPNGAFLQAFTNFVLITPNLPNDEEVPEANFAKTDVGPGKAAAKGLWVRRDPTNPIPEPSAALLFVVGGLVVHASRRRARG